MTFISSQSVADGSKKAKQ